MTTDDDFCTHECAHFHAIYSDPSRRIWNGTCHANHADDDGAQRDGGYRAVVDNPVCRYFCWNPNARITEGRLF